METTLSRPINTFKEKGFTAPLDAHPPTRERAVIPKNPEIPNTDTAKTSQMRSTIEASSSSTKAEFTKDTLLFFQHVGIV
ncbi:hypothetical protein HZC27_04200 [Candidatus Roizmanbacteria bacterium]|nr:hypothetical protein [Candidatus Roizmanbacteria bacterium]